MTDTRAAGASRPAGIVEAKLAAPAPRPDHLVREALVTRLVASRPERVVAVIAPPGYGKTTLLAQWLAREPRPVGWLTVDPADADPSVLLTYLATAIDRAIGLDPAVIRLLATPDVAALTAAVPRLATALHRRDPRLVLVVDDVHRLAGSPSIDALAMLVDYLPGGVEVAIAGRTDAGLPLARYRAAGMLLDIGDVDLAYDRTETGRVAALIDNELSADEVSRLHEATEGWPAAVYLAARRARSRVRDGTDGTSGLIGPDRAIGAYIDAELLGGTTTSIRTFMTRTAILERMTGDLCDAVLGRTGSATVLRRLAAENALVARLEAPGSWYRYHPLLREHLRDRLTSTPDDLSTLHRRAADWLVAHDMADQAIEHLLAADDTDGAAERIAEIALPLYRQGRGSAVGRWIDRLHDADLRRHPYVAVFGAWMCVLHGEHAEAERLVGLVAGVKPDGNDAGAGAFTTASALVEALMARSGLAPAVARAEQAVQLEPAWGEWRPIALTVLGAALAVAGDRDRADAILRDTVDAAVPLEARRALVSAFAFRALVAIDRDDWLEARLLVDEGLAIAEAYRRDTDSTLAAIAAVAARVSIRRNALAEARAHLATFQAARPVLTVAMPWYAARFLIEAARAHVALSDQAGARALLRQADDILRLRPHLGGLPDEVAALRARIHNLPPGPGGASTLTTAEIRVLQLLPTWLSVPEIAERLFVSPSTIRTQVQAIYGKLGASSRTEAVEMAIDAGLLEPLPMLSREGINSP